MQRGFSVLLLLCSFLPSLDEGPHRAPSSGPGQVQHPRALRARLFLPARMRTPRVTFFNHSNSIPTVRHPQNEDQENKIPICRNDWTVGPLFLPSAKTGGTPGTVPGRFPEEVGYGGMMKHKRMQHKPYVNLRICMMLPGKAHTFSQVILKKNVHSKGLKNEHVCTLRGVASLYKKHVRGLLSPRSAIAVPRTAHCLS